MTAKICSNKGCSKVKQHGRSYRYCEECGPIAKAEVRKVCNSVWYKSTTRKKQRAAQLLYRYGLSEDEFYLILETQENVCAICGSSKPTSKPKGTGWWHVDHDHACCPGVRSCGKCVRGILCPKCNLHVLPVAEGLVLAKAIAYLESHSK